MINKDRRELLESLNGKILADLGKGIVVASIPTSHIKEQDINARVMKDDMYKQLVTNIGKRGQLESLPFCALTDKVEIVSGHHRVRASKDAQIKDIPILLDMSGLNRSQIASKQLSHNAINGFDDKATMREIAKIMDNVDDILDSFVAKDVLDEQMETINKVLTPQIEFDWKNVVFTFLPHQIADMDNLISSLERNGEYVYFAPREEYDRFIDATANVQKFANIKNMGATIHKMIDYANAELEEGGFNEEMEYMTLASIFGNATVPKEEGLMIKDVFKKISEEYGITKKQGWKIFEVLAKDYIAKQEN